MTPADLSPTVDPDAEEQAQATVLKTLLATAQHSFGGFSHLMFQRSPYSRLTCITRQGHAGISVRLSAPVAVMPPQPVRKIWLCTSQFFSAVSQVQRSF